MLTTQEQFQQAAMFSIFWDMYGNVTTMDTVLYHISLLTATTWLRFPSFLLLHGGGEG